MLALDDATICALVAAAYERDAKLGLLCEVMSETGTRPSQAARLKVRFLIEHPTAPQLRVNRSGKGGGRNRAEKKLKTDALPISIALARKLKQAAAGRGANDRLLLRSDGQPWSEDDMHGDYRRDLAEIVKALGLNPKITGYCFRHSSVCRQLFAEVPPRIVAANHNTSLVELERTYSEAILKLKQSGDLTRAALLDHQPAPVGGNVVPLVR
jgi:integrase